MRPKVIAISYDALFVLPLAFAGSMALMMHLHHAGGMQYAVGSRNNGALLGLIETCIWLYMSQLNSLLLLLTEDYLEPCRSMLCPV